MSAGQIVKRQAKYQLLKWTSPVWGPIVILLALVVMALGGMSAVGQSGSSATIGIDQPSQKALSEIPSNLLALYQSSFVRSQCQGLSWTVLAAINKTESNFGQNNGPSSAGALGPMQFLPSTFTRNGVDGPGAGGVPDGVIDIMDPYDAVPSAAKYLCALLKENNNDLRQAIWGYNHSWAYVDSVLALAQQYAAVPVIDPRVEQAVQLAQSVEGTPYIWGGESEANGFDCSGLVWWAYSTAGIPVGSRTTAAGEYSWGTPVPLASLQRGDLVFWVPSPGNPPSSIEHVAIYLGNGRIVAAPHSGDVVKEQSLYDTDRIIGGVRVTG